MKKYYADNLEHFIPMVPRMTQPIEHGISVASEPGEANRNRAMEILKRDNPMTDPKKLESKAQESFGQSRSNAIKEALMVFRALAPGEQTYEAFLDLVKEEFAKRGIDIDNPQQNS